MADSTPPTQAPEGVDAELEELAALSDDERAKVVEYAEDVAKEAEAAAAKLAGDPPAPPEGFVEEPVEHLWRAVRDFACRHATQLLRFKAGDELEHSLGAALAAKGAPVRPVE